MLTALMIAITYKFQLVLGPALVIVLIAILAFALRFPLYRKTLGGILVLVSLTSVIITPFLAFFWGFVIGLITLIIGLLLGFFYVIRDMHTKRLNSPRLRKSIYIFFAILIVVCSLIVSVRITGVV